MTIDYSQRAANRPMPAGWTPPHPEVIHTLDDALALDASGLTFYCDWSEFQPVVTHAYPYLISCTRADNGNEIDAHAVANWRVLEPWEQIRLSLIYAVFKPGQNGAILKRLRNTYGSDISGSKIRPMTDMESGKQFASPGNHSTEANDFVAELAQWCGAVESELGYANAPDWASCWPSRPAGLKRSLAFYSADPTPPNYYARQFYGALPYGVPRGYPTSVKPFGPYVDINVIPKAIDDIADDFATDWLSMATQAQVQEMIDGAVTKIEATVKAGNAHLQSGLTNYNYDNLHPGSEPYANKHLMAQTKTAVAGVAAIQAHLGLTATKPIVEEANPPE